jgi:lysyl-tRNA synthetase class 2
MHHLVVGIVMALAAGAFHFALAPEEGFWQLFLAAVFGSGAALVLDEFALVFRLHDVYWTEEGRSSVDAVVISTVLAGLLLLHTAPLGAGEDSSRWVLSALILVNSLLVLATALKGKLFTAAVGVFVPYFALVGALRLAKPTSLWARHRYRPGSHKLERAEARYAWYAERWRPYKDKVEDVIGGAPAETSGEA